MFEETNQTKAIEENAPEFEEENNFTEDDGSDWFTDEEASETEEENEADDVTENDETVAGEEATSETDAEDVENSPGAQGEYTIKHLGKDIKLSLTDLINLAQKGMDYDHVKEQRDTFSKAHDVIGKYATTYNMDPEAYLSSLEAQYGNIAAQKFAGENNMSEDAARQILNLQNELKNYKAQESETEKNNKMKNDFSAFMQAHPDLDAKTLPQDFFDRYLDDGMSFDASYAMHENGSMKSKIADLEARLAAAEKNEQNKKTAVGSAVGDNNGAVADAFLEGLNSL